MLYVLCVEASKLISVILLQIVIIYVNIKAVR